MIKIKNSKLNKKETRLLFEIFSENQDLYLDFYFTKNNLRLFIKENPEIILKNIENGDYLIYDSEGNGVLLVLGYSDNFSRKYVKILGNTHTASFLLAALNQFVTDEVFFKINKKNPLLKILTEFGFEFLGNRGKEILMIRRKKC